MSIRTDWAPLGRDRGRNSLQTSLSDHSISPRALESHAPNEDLKAKLTGKAGDQSLQGDVKNCRVLRTIWFKMRFLVSRGKKKEIFLVCKALDVGWREGSQGAAVDTELSEQFPGWGAQRGSLVGRTTYPRLLCLFTVLLQQKAAWKEH